jgi:tetratricopeptide (TPR) repeat protein
MTNIRQADKSQAYDVYLSERAKGDNKFNPTFYIDVAEYFFGFNRTVALQILSNVADLTLESAYLYKTLMYYFKQYEAFDDCLHAAKKVCGWRPFEPQSHRDLALAYELVGNIDDAAKELSNALNTTFYSEVANRVDGMQDSILMDVSRMAAEYGASYFGGLFDPKYLSPLPVDLRVVLTWSQPNVDLDLHVVDPRGEDCYYGNKRTTIGGRFSKDFTSGLGPEQYLLKTFAKGEYTVKSSYFAETKFTENGPITVNVEIYRQENGKIKKTYRTKQMKTLKESGVLSRFDI